jgi:hypothetical protein
MTRIYTNEIKEFLTADYADITDGEEGAEGLKADFYVLRLKFFESVKSV